MAVTFDTSAVSVASTSAVHGTTHTLSYTVGSGAGAVLFVVVFSSNSSGATIFDSCTYNGVSMTRMGTRTNGAQIEVWYLNAPAQGAAHNIVGTITADQSNKLQIAALSYLGSGGFTGNSTDSQVTSVSTITKTLDTTVDGSWVGYGVMNVGGPAANTAGGVDRQSYQFNVAGDTNSAKTPAGTVSVSFNGSNNSWAWFLWEIPPIQIQPSVNDTVTITENIALQVVSFPSVSDSVTITEAVTMLLRALPSINDTVTITENIALTVFDFPSVNDTVTVTEATTITVVDMPNVFDAVTITENLTLRVFALPSVFDAVTITEGVTVVIPTLVPSVFDTVTITESISTPTISFRPSVFDTVTITENLAFNTISQFSVNDTVTVTENVNVNQVLIVRNPTTSWGLKIIG